MLFDTEGDNGVNERLELKCCPPPLLFASMLCELLSDFFLCCIILQQFSVISSVT